VGKNVTGTTIGKTFGVASLLTGQLTLLVNQTDTFSLLSLHAGEPKVNSFYYSIKPGSQLGAGGSFL
jgi:hypothetical protein